MRINRIEMQMLNSDKASVTTVSPRPIKHDKYRIDRPLTLAHRNLLCSNYTGCLDIVVIRNWSNWSCDGCGAYKPIDWTNDDWSLDAQQCADLVAEFVRLERVEPKKPETEYR